jgi:hypothetical protein
MLLQALSLLQHVIESFFIENVMHFVRQSNKTTMSFSIQFFQKFMIRKYKFFLHFNYFMLFHICVTTIRSCALKCRVSMNKQEIKALVVRVFSLSCSVNLNV